MTDLVTRLRDLRMRPDCVRPGWVEEAADEIERLDKMANDAFKAVAELGAERNRLREALRKIPHAGLYEARAIARKTLEGERA